MATAGFRAAADSAGAVLDSGVGRAVILASNVASFSLARLGRCGAALEAARKGEEAHRSVSLPSDWYPWFSQFVRCEGLVQAGRIDEAHALARQEYTASLQQGSTEGRAFFAWALARPVAERGDVDVAIGAAREGVSLFRQLGRPAFELNALVPLALSLALAGRGREAGETLEAIEALAVGPGMWVAVELLQARAMAALAGGRLTLARDLLVEVVRCGQAIGDLVGVASALHTLARLGRPDEHAPELAAVAADIEGDLAPARAAHGLALARNDPEALTAVSVQFDHLGATLLAAYAAVDAYRLWDGAGDARSAAARARAVELAARCPGAAISGLRGGDPDRRLTPAETEAARLAAAGHSNREIAEMLALSVRTIENRLQRIYDKLGLSSRTELAALFSETTP
jgi:DNA-binding CsgD family transcriptional regulator